MKNKIVKIFLILSALGLIAFAAKKDIVDDSILSYTVDPKSQNVQLYWKNDQGEILENIQNLITFVESKHSKLLFATNAGMYKADHSPKGLFIQNQKTLAPLDTSSGEGNFYLKPNGVFYLTADNTPFICKTADFIDTGQVKFATQSGPMLLVDGAVHAAFKAGSTNLNIRNGVGVLPNNHILFAMSKKEINFYDFADYFKKMGCKNALYLDGFVSRTFLPEKNWMQTDGNFGVMIGVVVEKQ
jgi:uncharacterized protein YigE (DUF2233 family)